ncbi:hypothetical protein ABW636_12495 [Aquimarina sp. 2201CG1-2-11]|uniref:hypothetical protein n=1 Tax=Aquimarina discodermiae TaxID=3231043 RepID=UPI00346247D6
MSNENSNEEIDLMQVFGLVKNVFRKFLKGVISLISFFIKKAILLIILVVVGAFSGYFIDQNRGITDGYVHEVIIEPKYGSIKYIYDFIKELDENFKEGFFFKKAQIEWKDINNLVEVRIEPMIKGNDVLDYVERHYDKKEFFEDVMEAYEEGELEDSKFKDFYRHHKLIFVFRNTSEGTTKIIDKTVKYLKSNSYYRSKIDLVIAQNKINLERDKNTLNFVNEYLDNLGKNPTKEKNEVVLLANTKDDIPTVVASLLQQKRTLIESITKLERAIKWDNEIMSIVDYGEIVSVKKRLIYRFIVILPIVLVGLALLVFLIIYGARAVLNFVNEEQ